MGETLKERLVLSRPGEDLFLERMVGSSDCTKVHFHL
jgi:hypothetical protein